MVLGHPASHEAKPLKAVIFSLNVILPSHLRGRSLILLYAVIEIKMEKIFVRAGQEGGYPAARLCAGLHYTYQLPIDLS
jgi:hypothetical protein